MSKPLFLCLLLFCSAVPSIGAQDGASQQQARPAGEASKALMVGGAVKPPKPIHMVQPAYTEDARRKKINAECTLSLVVDTDGLPQQVSIVKPAASGLPAKQQKYGAGLDAQAVRAVEQYRFEPATLNGQPVAVKVDFQVEFRIY